MNVSRKMDIMFKENKTNKTMFIAYKIGESIYASQSIEVRKILDVKSIQNSEDGIGNFIFINGKEIPVLNLHERLDQNDVTPWEFKSVIVLKVRYRETYSLIGLIVDRVNTLFDVYEDQIRYSLLTEDLMYSEFIDGYYNYQQEMIKLINIKKLINTDSSVVIRNWNKKRKLVLIN